MQSIDQVPSFLVEAAKLWDPDKCPFSRHMSSLQGELPDPTPQQTMPIHALVQSFDRFQHLLSVKVRKGDPDLDVLMGMNRKQRNLAYAQFGMRSSMHVTGEYWNRSSGRCLSLCACHGFVRRWTGCERGLFVPTTSR